MSDYAVEMHRGKYCVRWREDGKRPRRSLGTTDRGEAEALAREWWERRARPASGRIADLWPGYFAHLEDQGKDTSNLGYRIKNLKPHFNHRLGSAITEADCKTYAAHRLAEGLSTETPRLELTYLRACLNLAKRKGHIPAGFEIWLPPKAAPRDYYLTKPMVDRLFAAIETLHVRSYVALGITTGARQSAILNLKWDQVDLDSGFINFLPKGVAQTSKRKPIVPINNRARETLAIARDASLSDYVIEFNGAPIKSVKTALSKASLRSKVKVSAHVLRHTAGVWMAQAGVPMEKIAQYLGHSNLETTRKHYAHYSPDYLTDAAAALEF